MLIRQNVRLTPAADFLATLPPGRRWRRIALVASGSPDEDVVAAAASIARRDGAQIVLYDAAAVTRFTSPYPPGTHDWLPDLLGQEAMHRVGRADLAIPARTLAQEGLLGGIYLSPRVDASDLPDLVRREAIDLVVCLLPSGDKRLRHVHDTRRYAHLVLSPAGEVPRLLAPFGPGDILPAPEGIHWPYLMVILVAFVLARLRNTA